MGNFTGEATLRCHCGLFGVVKSYLIAMSQVIQILQIGTTRSGHVTHHFLVFEVLCQQLCGLKKIP